MTKTKSTIKTRKLYHQLSKREFNGLNFALAKAHNKEQHSANGNIVPVFVADPRTRSKALSIRNHINSIFPQRYRENLPEEDILETEDINKDEIPVTTSSTEMGRSMDSNGCRHLYVGPGPAEVDEGIQVDMIALIRALVRSRTQMKAVANRKEKSRESTGLALRHQVEGRRERL